MNKKLPSILISGLFISGLFYSCKKEKFEVWPNSNMIELKHNGYNPGEITIPKGTTITWKNNENVKHTVSSSTSLFESGEMLKGDSFSYTFNGEGTFSYHCKLHGSMTGTIHVQ